jgi:hypothetical protein
MDQFDSSLDKEYESLNEAIMKALVTSKDVKAVLKDFQSKELINNMSVLNLVLSLEELSQLVFSGEHDFDSEDTEPESSAKPVAKKKVKVSPNIIDGKALSKNEVLFESFCQGMFDENDWIKKAKLRM